MTGKTFLNRVVNGQTDVVALLLDLLKQIGAEYCVIGGLAVNAYAEPVVSLDLDLVVVTDKIEALCEAAGAKGIRIERFEHSVHLSVPGSDLRIQLQTDPCYQEFIPRAVQRRRSKRQKDLADILRMVETHPQVRNRLPPDIEAQVG